MMGRGSQLGNPGQALKTAFLHSANPLSAVRRREQPLQQKCHRRVFILSGGGPASPPPSYAQIDANPFNKVFTRIFQSKLEGELGRQAGQSGYDGVIETVMALSIRYRNPADLQLASERVLLSLFPGWLPPAFVTLFSKPFPVFAAWINAVVTVGVTQWLMGPSSLDEDGVTVNIERCRYLEGKTT